MKRATGVILVLTLLVAGGILLLRPGLKEDSPRRRPVDAAVTEPAPGASPVPEPPIRPTPPRPSPPPSVPAPPAPPVPPAPTSAGPPLGALLHGTVRLAAPPQRQKWIRMQSDPSCAAFHSDRVPSEEVVVDRDLGLRWAFVYVGEGARPTASPAAPLVLAQSGCLYHPHVLGIQVGQPLLLRNDDPLLHSIHTLAFANRNLCFGQPTQGLEQRVQFWNPEVMMQVRCDVHPWMKAWIGVLDHPYFAVTDAAGAYALPELPPGVYTVEVWHEAYRSVRQRVELRRGDQTVLNFRLDDRE